MSTGENERAWGQSNPRRTRLNYLLRFVAALLVGVVSLLCALTVMTVTDTFSGGPHASATGTAQVVQCTERGPVSLAGLGYFHRCQADVTWDDGSASREWFPAGQLSPDDRGQAVPVFEPKLPDTARRGGPLATEPGRNDSAKWVSVGLIGALVLGLVGVIALCRAMFDAYGLVRQGHGASGTSGPGRGQGEPVHANANRETSRRDRGKSDWPTTDADEAAVPRFRREVRAKWLSIAVCLGIVLQLFSSIPYNDAPRAVDFVSSWPEITEAWLFGPGEPSVVVDFGVFLVGAGVAALIAAMSAGIRGSSAELVRYGMPRLMKERDWSRKQATKELRRMADARRAAYRRGVAFALVVLGVAGYATVSAIGALPADAPLLVVIAGLRDAIVLTVIGIVLLVTVEPPYDRISRLLAIHEERASISGTHGTDARGAES